MLIYGILVFGLGLLSLADEGPVGLTQKSNGSEIATRAGMDCESRGAETLANCRSHCRLCPERFCFFSYESEGVKYHNCLHCSQVSQYSLTACEGYCTEVEKCRIAKYSCKKVTNGNLDSYVCST